MVDAMSSCIIKNEVPFCELDAYAGDGDFGMSIAKGFRQLKKEWRELTTENIYSIGEFLTACSMVLMEYCGGASGPIWGSAFREAGKKTQGKTELTALEFAKMMQAAVQGAKNTEKIPARMGRAGTVGDRSIGYPDAGAYALGVIFTELKDCLIFG